MKRILSAAAACLLAGAFAACNGSKETPTADVAVYGWYKWNPEEVSPDSLQQLFKLWKSHGLVGVCVECGGFQTDRIQTAARIAHDEGLEYHAWVPSMLHGDMDSTWYTVNRLGKSAYREDDRAYVAYYQTLDPHHPEVVKYLAEQYAKVAEIPEVDYVQLDYIRYADVVLSEGLWVKYDTIIDHNWGSLEGWNTDGGKCGECEENTGEGCKYKQEGTCKHTAVATGAKPDGVAEYPGADYCYCDACVADFKAKSGIDVREAVKKGVDPATIEGWAQFRCDNVTNCVNAIAEAVHAKGKKLSADVFPGPKSYAQWMVRQQWDKWDVDVYFPMNYNDFYLRGPKWVGRVTREEVEAAGDKPVYSGLFICHDWENKRGDIDPENSGLVPSEIAAAVQAAREAGSAGICLFCPNHMTEAHWQAFDEAIGLK